MRCEKKILPLPDIANSNKLIDASHLPVTKLSFITPITDSAGIGHRARTSCTLKHIANPEAKHANLRKMTKLAHMQVVVQAE